MDLCRVVPRGADVIRGIPVSRTDGDSLQVLQQAYQPSPETVKYQVSSTRGYSVKYSKYMYTTYGTSELSHVC